MMYEKRVMESLDNILNSDIENLKMKEIFFVSESKVISLPFEECVTEDCVKPTVFPKSNIVFVGHSLGGALAKSAGLKFVDSTIFSVSGPGYYLSPTEYSNITSRIRNVKPNRDVVPMVGA